MNLQSIRRVAFGLAIGTLLAFADPSHSQDPEPLVIIYYLQQGAEAPPAAAVSIYRSGAFSFSMSPGEGAMFSTYTTEVHFRGGGQTTAEGTLRLRPSFLYYVRVTSTGPQAKLEQVGCVEATKDIGQTSSVVPQESSGTHLLPIQRELLKCK
jgi:hypothetical protein